MKASGIKLLFAASAMAALAACGPDGTRTVPADRNVDRSMAVDIAERQAIAEWAMEHGVSGLSPASAGAPAPSALEARYQDQIALTRYAMEHGLSGLWVASVRPVDDDTTDTTTP